MNKKYIYIDIDIFLDTILKRKPHHQYSDKIISLCEQNEIKGFTSALVIANIFYIINKAGNFQMAIKAIGKIRSIIKVLPLTDKEIGESINAEFKDFEDGVQYFVSINNKINFFITRNIKDFTKASTAILSPQEYLELLGIKD